MGDFYGYSAFLVIILSTSLWSIFCDDFSLDFHDGICTQNVSEPKMLIKYQRVPYTTTYLSRCWPDLNCIKTKLNTRLEPYYQVRNQESEIQVCCEGYKADGERSRLTEGSSAVEGKLVCKPKCTALCINAHCSSPNTCTCHTDHTKDRNAPNICIPICDITCIDGHCEEPNVCSCKPGYEIKDNPGICQPICDGPCLNGTCVLPDVCECLPGFSLDSYRSHVCNPICEFGCANGICIAPGICQCLPGYNFVRSSKRYCVNSSINSVGPMEDAKMDDLRNWADMLRISGETSKVKDSVEDNRYTISRDANVSINSNNEKCNCAKKGGKIHHRSHARVAKGYEDFTDREFLLNLIATQKFYWLRFAECIFLLLGFAIILLFVFLKLDWRNALSRLNLLKIGHLCFLNPLYHDGEKKSVVKV